MARFEDVLTLNDFDSVNDGATLKAGVWNEIARYQVKPGEARAWGFHKATTIADVLKGHIKAVIKDSGGTNTLSQGKIRLVYSDPNEERKVTYMTFNLSEIANGKELIEDIDNIAYPYRYLIVEVKPASDFTWSKADSELEVSTTVYTGADIP